MDKMQRTARGLDIVFKILSILTIAGIAVLVLLNAIGLGVGYDRLMDSGSVSLNISAGGIHISPADIATPAEIGRIILLISIASAVGLAAIWYGIRIIRRILAPMKLGQPFNQGISGEFRKLGWFVIVCGIAYNAFDLFIKTQLALRLVSSQVQYPEVGIEHHLSPTFLIIGFVLFLCSYIFRYGEELQQLSDETL